MSFWLNLMVLISITGCAEFISVKAPEKYVNVTVGESALLQCTFTTSQETANLIIQWNFYSKSSMSPKQVYYYQSGQDVITTAYQGRLQPPVLPQTSRNASITLSKMQPTDSGVYTCDVHNFPDVDGQSEANIIVNVFEKPSVPVCAVHGNAASGHEVTLICHSEQGSPTPTYTWTKVDQTRTRRPAMGRASTTGLLHIRNISEFEFGEYQCKSENVVGFSICTLELSSDAGHGVIAGAVIGALLGCVLIVLIVWFIAHKMKKRRYAAVKAGEPAQTRGGSHQTPVDRDGVTMATTQSHIQAEGEEAHA